jgi:hypothetical protein
LGTGISIHSWRVRRAGRYSGDGLPEDVGHDGVFPVVAAQPVLDAKHPRRHPVESDAYFEPPAGLRSPQAQAGAHRLARGGEEADGLDHLARLRAVVRAGRSVARCEHGQVAGQLAVRSRRGGRDIDVFGVELLFEAALQFGAPFRRRFGLPLRPEHQGRDPAAHRLVGIEAQVQPPAKHIYLELDWLIAALADIRLVNVGLRHRLGVGEMVEASGGLLARQRLFVDTLACGGDGATLEAGKLGLPPAVVLEVHPHLVRPVGHGDREGLAPGLAEIAQQVVGVEIVAHRTGPCGRRPAVAALLVERLARGGNKPGATGLVLGAEIKRHQPLDLRHQAVRLEADIVQIDKPLGAIRAEIEIDPLDFVRHQVGVLDALRVFRAALQVGHREAQRVPTGAQRVFADVAVPVALARFDVEHLGPDALRGAGRVEEIHPQAVGLAPQAQPRGSDVDVFAGPEPERAAPARGDVRRDGGLLPRIHQSPVAGGFEIEDHDGFRRPCPGRGQQDQSRYPCRYSHRVLLTPDMYRITYYNGFAVDMPDFPVRSPEVFGVEDEEAGRVRAVEKSLKKQRETIQPR